MTHLIHASTRHVVVALIAGLPLATVAPAAQQAPSHLEAAADRLDAIAAADLALRALAEEANAGR
jgi:hypothetical protein